MQDPSPAFVAARDAASFSSDRISVPDACLFILCPGSHTLLLAAKHRPALVFYHKPLINGNDTQFECLFSSSSSQTTSVESFPDLLLLFLR